MWVFTLQSYTWESDNTNTNQMTLAIKELFGTGNLGKLITITYDKTTSDHIKQLPLYRSYRN